MARKIAHLTLDGGWSTVCGRPAAHINYTNVLAEVTCLACKHSMAARRGDGVALYHDDGVSQL